MTSDLLQVIEMDLPQLGVGEESFHHRDERQGKQSCFGGAVASLVWRWSPSFPFSGYSVMSHIGAGLSVSRITTGIQCFEK